MNREVHVRFWESLRVRLPGATYLRQTLASLPERERRTIELVYYDGLTAVEIAKCTGETVRVVRHNLYRGLERLRRSICEGDSRRSGTKIGGRWA